MVRAEPVTKSAIGVQPVTPDGPLTVAVVLFIVAKRINPSLACTASGTLSVALMVLPTNRARRETRSRRRCRPLSPCG